MTSEPGAPEQTVPSLRDRMRAAGLSDERIAAHAEANAIVLDGELVADLDPPAPAGQPLALHRPLTHTSGSRVRLRRELLTV